MTSIQQRGPVGDFGFRPSCDLRRCVVGEHGVLQWVLEVGDGAASRSSLRLSVASNVQ